jgi:hypothetical protein
MQHQTFESENVYTFLPAVLDDPSAVLLDQSVVATPLAFLSKDCKKHTQKRVPQLLPLSVLHADEHCFLYVRICFQLKNWMEISIINYKNKMSRRRPTTLMAKDTPLWISHISLIDHLITLQGYKQSQSRTIEVRELALKKIKPKCKLRANITLNGKNMHSVCKERMFMGHPWCTVDVPIFPLAAVEENG